MGTAGGLLSSNTWHPRVYFDRDRLMKAWRMAVIALLRAALRAGLLRGEIGEEKIDDLLSHLARCWRSIKIQLDALESPGRAFF